MDMNTLQDHWNALGKTDPLEAILDRSGKRDGPWELQKFFATGEAEIDGALDYIKSLGVAVPNRTALDFGCGVGRLTQALARHFQKVFGVDIAPSMLALAGQYNRFGESCQYVLNDTDNLPMFSDGSVDFIYSAITLQHMHPRFSKNYLKEFLRILAPGGILVFQIPSEPILINENGSVNLPGLILRVFPKWFLDATYRRIRYGNRPRAEGYTIRKKDMLDFLDRNGGRVLSVMQNRGPILLDCTYYVTKAG
jgi:ubiquinone/menaquinone biosynthesis C-methylase UbiE